MADLKAARVLTLPPAEAAALVEAYQTAVVILEYGSAGSTVVAGARAQGMIFSVESDAARAADLRGWFDAHPPRSTVILHQADIGPTRAWGFLKGKAALVRWPDYALSVWDRPDFRAPDLVLVNGRFRLACMITTLFSITAPTVLLVDDYRVRPADHRFEALAGRPRMIGRMVFFNLTATPDLPDDIGWIADSHTDPA